MRRFACSLVAASLATPASAMASPYALAATMAAQPAEGTPTSEGEDAVPAGVDYTPTSSKAPPSETPIPEPSEPAPAEPEGPADDRIEPEPEPEAEPAPAPAPTEERVDKWGGPFNKHGIGVRGGITVIPTWILSKFLATHGNALCRGGNIGNFAEERGLLKQDGCNFYIGGEYVYRHSRLFDIVASVGYQHAHAPDSYWLDKDEWADDCEVHDGGRCNLSAADYTEVNLGLVYLEADFIGRYPVVVTKDVEFGIGGGGGIGLGIVTGGVYQTNMGTPPLGYQNGMMQNTCQRLEDLADFTRCTPHYDPAEDPDMDFDPNDLSEPNPLGFAKCSKDKCDKGDLEAFGYRKKQSDIPPVLPVVNLMLSMRLIVKDVFGITVSGGFNTGFYFGASMAYFFGKNIGKKSVATAAPETAFRPRPYLSRF
ncbi:MAG: hypothetical protein D6705_02095 [Deltaproteobacteria bacterium]|nr:MAG: hypothetical protein D6705_02095 [Deltaproteobacteria bacterium]